jgi:hypothetical protein
MVMKPRNLLKILAIAALGGFAPGFAAASGDADAASGAEGAGERLVLELQAAVSSESSQVGDTISFKVLEPFTAGDGVRVEAGREVLGIVTVAQPSGRLGRAGRLGIEIQDQGLNRVGLPLEIVRPSAKGARGKLGIVRRAVAPLAKVGRSAVSLGDSKSVQAQAVQLAAGDPELARDVAARAIGAADPLAEVELESDRKAARVAKRGVRAIARLGGGYLNTMLNGPAGALRRGGSIEVPAGARVEAAIK